MLEMLCLANKGTRIFARRLKTQGVRTTLTWIFARVIPYLTGVPIVKYSRLTSQIYVGPQHHRAGRLRLEQLGIRYSVNMRYEFDDTAHGLALENHLRLPTADDEAPSLDHLCQGVAFIHSAVSSGEKVYIHCAAGVGRAPTMVAAYLISGGMTVDGALAMIRRVRPFIKLTPPQIDQLGRFEAMGGCQVSGVGQEIPALD